MISDTASQVLARHQAEVTAKAAPLTARRLDQWDQAHRSQTPRSHPESRSHVAFAHAMAPSNFAQTLREGKLAASKLHVPDTDFF